VSAWGKWAVADVLIYGSEPADPLRCQHMRSATGLLQMSEYWKVSWFGLFALMKFFHKFRLQLVCIVQAVEVSSATVLRHADVLNHQNFMPCWLLGYMVVVNYSF
jgi:hypothetical protein